MIWEKCTPLSYYSHAWNAYTNREKNAFDFVEKKTSSNRGQALKGFGECQIVAAGILVDKVPIMHSTDVEPCVKKPEAEAAPIPIRPMHVPPPTVDANSDMSSPHASF